MNKLAIRAGIMAGLATISVAAFAFAGEFKKFIMAETPKGFRAFQMKNLAYFQNVSTDDFVYVGMGGQKQGKKESMASLKQMFDQAKTIVAGGRVKSTTENAKGGAVEMESSYDILLKPGKDGKTHRMQVQSWTRETWVQVGNAYKVQKIEDLKPSKMMMDGKPMAMPKMIEKK